MKTISALCIGDELLDGRIRDENAWWLAQLSAEQGFPLHSIHIIGDDMDTIVAQLEACSQRADILIVCGGMGPTADDITHHAAAKWMGVPLEVDSITQERIQQRFAQRGRPFTPNNLRQASFPTGAEILATDVGTAAGFVLQKHGCRVYFLPGVPSEYRWFIAQYLTPVLTPAGQAEYAAHRTRLCFFGAGESWLEAQLTGIESLAQQLQARVSYLAQAPVIEVHLKALTQAGLDALRNFVLERVGKWLIAEGGETLTTRLCKLLSERAVTVSTAESCTAGLVASKIAAVPGASDWFKRGFITYASEAKTELLGVRPEIIARYNAVSAQTACQMAAGAQRAAGADFALAVTGFAGPTGGTADIPIGTVHFALAAPDGVWHYKRLFPHRTRDEVLSASVYVALSLLLWHLEARLAEHPVNGPFTAAQVWATEGVPTHPGKP